MKNSGNAEKAGFWFGGGLEYRKGLEEQRARELAALTDALDKAHTREDATQIEAQIEGVKRKYDQLERESGELLF